MSIDLPRRPTGFVTLFEEMQLMFDHFRVGAEHKRPTWRPTLDVLEEDDQYVVVAELPGVDPDDVEVIAGDRRLEISGIRQPPEAYLKAQHHHIERCYGYFERVIYMNESIDPERVTTELEDGVLTILLPKK